MHKQIILQKLPKYAKIKCGLIGDDTMLGAIFDIDGTILDSMTVWVDITNAFFNEHGVAITKEQNLKYQEMSFEESLIAIHNEHLTDMSVKDMFDEFQHRAAMAYTNTLPAKPYVCEYIKELHKSGVKLAVATSGFEELVKPALKRLGVLDCFSVFAYSKEVGRSKSSPDIYLLAAKRLGLEPKDCTVFEDIITGIMSAKDAGFGTIAIADPTNVHEKSRLIQYSDRYITGWEELLSNI